MTEGIAHELLLAHVRGGGADLYMTGGQEPRATTPVGQVVVGPTVSNEALQQLLQSAATTLQRSHFERTGTVVLTLEIADARLHAMFFRTATGMAANFHRLPDRLPDSHALELPEPLLELIQSSRGVVLVTGPQRSGKSTLLAGLLAYRLRASSEHVVTVEEPIKFVLRPEHGLCTQLAVGRDVRTYEEGLERAIDLGASVLVVRDPPSQAFERVLTAAEAGVFVLASIAAHDVDTLVGQLTHALCPHGGEAAIPRLVRSVSGLVLQRLLPDGGGHDWHAVREVYTAGTVTDSGDRAPPLPSLRLVTQSMQAQLVALVRERRVMVEDARRIALDLAAFDEELDARAIHAGAP